MSRVEAGGGPGILSRWVPPGAEPRVRAVVARAREQSPFWRERLAAAGVDPGLADGVESLAVLPVLRKESLGQVQAAAPPFGGLLAEPVERLARIFVSPGDIYDPQGETADFWRFSRALEAAGFRAGDRVINCFSYHLTPAGFMFDSAARALGCVVVPAGVGQQELQVRVTAAVGATGYVGLPSYLLALLRRAADMGLTLPLRRAVVTGEPLPPALREEIASFGVAVYQAYGTADVGLIGHECGQGPGLHLNAGVLVEICDPDGRVVPMGEVGEVVVTLLDETYPLLRFGTGDLSAMSREPCACGEPSLLLRGWLGRVGDVAKVRGIFLYPRQLEEAMAALTGVERWRAVVERDAHHRDLLRIQVAGPADPQAVRQAVQSAVRLNPEVESVPADAIPADGPRFEDRRRWD